MSKQIATIGLTLPTAASWFVPSRAFAQGATDYGPPKGSLVLASTARHTNGTDIIERFIDGQMTTELVPTSETNFLVVGLDNLPQKFEHGNDGDAIAFTVRQNCHTRRAPKVGPE